MNKYFTAIVSASIMVMASAVASAQAMNWGTLPSNTPGASVYAITSYDDGHGQALYVAGEFNSLCCSFQQLSDGIFRWNGSWWSSLWPGFDLEVYALTVVDHGQGPQLYAGGRFTNYKGVARWDGMQWHNLSTGLFGASKTAYAMTAYDDGSGNALYVGGYFNGAGSVSAKNIAKWDGTQWSALGSGLNGAVDYLCVYDAGFGPELYVSGEFTQAGGIATPQAFAKWNGVAWSAVGPLYFSGAGAMCVHDDGTGPALFICGNVPAVGAKYVAKWNGSQWAPVGQLRFGNIRAMTSFDDGSGPALFVCGLPIYLGGVFDRQYIAKWDGGHWSTVGGGTDNETYAMYDYDDGSGARSRLMVGGGFQHAGGIPAQNLAWWNGSQDPIDTFCSGDGTVANCPCMNQGSPGAGCQNSAQTGGAFAAAVGTPAANTLAITATGLLPHTLSIVFQGDVALTNGPKFGDGLMCVGGNRLRMYTQQSVVGAITVPGPTDLSIAARSATLGDTLSSGTVRYYQVFYRDPSPTFCPSPTGSTWNESNGLRIVW